MPVMGNKPIMDDRAQRDRRRCHHGAGCLAGFSADGVSVTGAALPWQVALENAVQPGAVQGAGQHDGRTQ